MHYALFDTGIGRCGIVWGERGIASVQLPEASAPETRARLVKRYAIDREVAPPPEVEQAIQGIVALLRGDSPDLSGIRLDLDQVTQFDRRVYQVARTIPPGATMSYGEVAARLDPEGTARAVGQALGRNPFAILVPCHRVVAAGGKVGGFSAHGGSGMKVRILAIESANLPLLRPSGW